MLRINLAAYSIRIVPAAGTGGVLATVEDLPGCVVIADTVADLHVVLEQAILIYLDDHPAAPAHFQDRRATG